MRKKNRLILFPLTAALLLIPLSDALATGKSMSGLTVSGEKIQNIGQAKRQTKLSSRFNHVRRQLAQHKINRANAMQKNAPAYSSMTVRVNQKAQIQSYIHFNSFAPSEKEILQQLGVEIEIYNRELGIGQAWIPNDKMEAVAALPFITKVTPPRYGRPRSGSVTSVGDIILKARDLRLLGFDGTGAKVGVISDGAQGMSSAMLSGDLPGGITVYGGCSGACNEGTAMMEIIHDLAPGAELAMGALNSSLDFINRVSDLRNMFGADIIVDDIGFFDEPYFEDGPVATAVKTAVDNGVIYVSACGNEANEHYQGEFSRSTELLGLVVGYDSEHNFGWTDAGTTDPGDSDPTLDITLEAGEATLIILQWNDQFGASANDYDLCIINDAEDTILGCSIDVQDGNDDPYEEIALENSGSETVTVKLVIYKYSSAAADTTFEMFFLGDPSREYVVKEGSVFGHPAVEGVLAVGAIDAQLPGHNLIQPYSSWGPSEVFFPSEETRDKPQFAGIDCVAVTGAAGFDPEFCGTSAAAPHIAALAALLKGGFTTNQEIFDALKDTAADLGDPGFDSVYGWGRPDVLAAATELNSAPEAIIDTPSSARSIDIGKKISFTGSCNDENSTDDMTYLWTFGSGSAVSNSTDLDAGCKKFNNAGTFNVTLSCIDAFDVADATPPSVTITVGDGLGEGDGECGGGGCAVSNNSPHSALLLLLLAAMALAQMRRRRAKKGVRNLFSFGM